MTIYIVENYYNEPSFKAYRTLEGAKLGLLEEYIDNCLPSVIKDIKEGRGVEGLTDGIKEDLKNILTNSYIEDFGIVHECELKE